MASCDCRRLQIGDVTREEEFLSNDYTIPTINSKTLMTLALTLADQRDAFESFCALVFCNFVRYYSCTIDCAVVTSLVKMQKPKHWLFFQSSTYEHDFKQAAC